MSTIRLECKVNAVDPNLAQINVNGTLKCPINWIINEYSELSGRYSQDSSENDEWNTFFRYTESPEIQLKSQDVFKEDINPIFRVKVKLNSTTDATGDVHIRTNAVGLNVVNIPTNVPTWIEVPLDEGGAYIRISQMDEDSTFQVYEGYSITFSTGEIDFFNEFVNYGIKNNLVNDITIGNTVHQRKIGKTVTTFSNELIISPSKNNEILDVLTYARLNKILTLVIINDKATVQGTLANLPQESGDQNYYYINHKSKQTTGIYEYVTISYQQDPLNGVY